MANEVWILVKTKADEAIKGFEDVRKKMDKFASDARKAGLAMSAIGAVGVYALKEFSEAALEQEKVVKSLGAVVANTGQDFEAVKQKVLDTTAALQKKTNFGDEAQIRALTKMTPILGSVELAMEALPAVMDAATNSGQDLESVSVILARALAGQTNEAGRLGIEFKENTKFGERLSTVFRKVGGSAEAAADPMIQLDLRLGDLKEQIGMALLPLLDSLTKLILPVIEYIGKWAEQNPALVRAITIATLVIGGLGVVLGTVGLVIPAVTAGIAAFGTVLTVATGPIGIIIVAIGALIAIGVLLWKNWDKVSQFFKNMWEGIKEAFSKAVNFIKQHADKLLFLLGPMGALIFGVKKMAGGWGEIWDWIRQKFTKALNAIKEAFSLTTPEIEKGGDETEEAGEKAKKSIPFWETLAFISLPAVGAAFVGMKRLIFDIDWSEVGNTIVNAFSTVGSRIAGFFTNVGSDIAGAFTGVDWAGIGTAIASPFQTAWQTISGVDWAGVGTTILNAFTGIGSDIAGFFTEIDWGKIGETIKNAFSTVGTSILGFFTNIGSDIAGFFTEIDWGKVGTDISDAFVDVKDDIVGYFSGLWDGVVDTATDIWAGIGGVKDNVVKAFTGVKESIVEHFSGLWSGFTSGASDAWGLVKGKVLKVWENIVDGAEGIHSFFSGLWSGFSGTASTWWGLIKSSVLGVWTNIKTEIGGYFTGLWDDISTAAIDAWNAIASAVSGIWSSISSAFRRAFATVVNTIIGSINAIISALNFINPFGDPIPPITPLDTGDSNPWAGLAKGATNFKGGLALVGEQGPELVNLPRGSDILPARQTASVLSGGGSSQSIVVNINNPVIYGEMDLKRLIVQTVRDHARGGGFYGVLNTA